jgi:hypothetical protein
MAKKKTSLMRLPPGHAASTRHARASSPNRKAATPEMRTVTRPRRPSNRHAHPWSARADLANTNANDGHGRPRMDVELIAARNPRE